MWIAAGSLPDWSVTVGRLAYGHDLQGVGLDAFRYGR